MPLLLAPVEGLRALLALKTRNSSNVVILGDFNVNLNGEEESPVSINATLKDKLLDTLPVEGYTQVIKIL